MTELEETPHMSDSEKLSSEEEISINKQLEDKITQLNQKCTLLESKLELVS